MSSVDHGSGRTRAGGRRLAALLLLLLLLAAGCSGASEAGDADQAGGVATPGPDEDEEEEEGVLEFGGEAAPADTFVHALDDEPLSLDPAGVEPGEGGETMILQVYERLVEFAPDGPDLIPGLAARVPSRDNGLISSDGLTYTFPIRRGVTFHDGSKLTAEDVKYSWDRVIEMDLPGSSSNLLTDNVARTAVSGGAFEVTLASPSASFLRSVVTAMVASVVSQEAVEGNGGITAGEPNEFMATNMVGTGPYRFAAWNRNENLQFEINDDYWGEPANLNLRIQVVPDIDTRVLGLRAREYDMIDADPSFAGDLRQYERIKIYSRGLLVEPIHIAFNLNVRKEDLPPEDTIPADFFHDPRIRRAFNHAYDYDSFVEGALGGFGDFNPHYIPQGVFGYDPSAPVYDRRDLDEAERLFREAGVWDQGFTISVIAEEGNLFEVAALVLKDSLEGLNPKFHVRVLAVAESQFDEAHATEPVPYAMWVKNADPFADPDAFMQAYEHPDGEWGQQSGFRKGYENPERIAQLIDDAAVELDEDTRAGMYAELQRLLYDDPMWLIAAQEGIANARSSGVRGFVLNPLWPRPNVKFALFDKG